MDFLEENLFLAGSAYSVLAVLVVVFSLFLSKYVDALDKKTDLSGAFIGGIMLAAVTSLPELFTSITAVCQLKTPDLVQGNVFGSNVFNAVILGLCFLFASKKFKTAWLSKSHIGTNIFVIVIFLICLSGLYFPFEIPIGIITVNWTTIVIIIVYAVNVIMMKSDDSAENNEESDLNLTVGQIVARFVIFAAALVIVSILLTNVTDILAKKLNLNGNVAGAVFLGVATSLPELTSSINLVRLGNYNAAFGNITGSNLFNFTILCFGDLLLTTGNILSYSKETVTILLCGLAASVFIMLSFYVKKNRPAVMLTGALIIAAYILSVVIPINFL